MNPENLVADDRLNREEREIVSRVSRRTFMGATAAATLAALAGREPQRVSAQELNPNPFSIPRIEAVLTMWPPSPWARMCGRKAWMP